MRQDFPGKVARQDSSGKAKTLFTREGKTLFTRQGKTLFTPTRQNTVHPVKAKHCSPGKVFGAVNDLG